MEVSHRTDRQFSLNKITNFFFILRGYCAFYTINTLSHFTAHPPKWRNSKHIKLGCFQTHIYSRSILNDRPSSCTPRATVGASDFRNSIFRRNTNTPSRAWDVALRLPGNVEHAELRDRRRCFAPTFKRVSGTISKLFRRKYEKSPRKHLERRASHSGGLD